MLINAVEDQLVDKPVFKNWIKLYSARALDQRFVHKQLAEAVYSCEPLSLLVDLLED